MASQRKALFLCTGNACRSQMAEATLRHLAGDRFEALSAGSHPAGFVHPLALAALDHLGIPVHNARSKSWNEFADRSVDVVITLCDDAAREACPAWPGDPIKVHWSMPDPVCHFGSEDERFEFALRVAERLRAKIEGLVQLDWSSDQAKLIEGLERLGRI